MITSANEILFRSSRIGDIMTDPKSKTIYLFDGIQITAQRFGKILSNAISTNDYTALSHITSQEIEVEDNDISETAKQCCIDNFLKYHYGRDKDIENKYIEKGLQVEEDSITLYSRIKKTFFGKNELRLINEFISGTPDIYTGVTIKQAEMIIDVKSSWDLFTFYKAKTTAINKQYYWQLQSYMWLTGAKQAELAYCLIDTPEALINDAKRKFMWKALITDENEVTQEYFKQLEINMLFQDIPLNERLYVIQIERNEADILRIKDRVTLCRSWIEANLLNTLPGSNRC